MNVMELPKAYVDQLFAQGLSYVYGVSIRLLCDSIPEPLEFYLGPGKPLHLLTLTFRSGGLHYSVTRNISTVISGNSQKREHEYAQHTPAEDTQQEKSKQKKKIEK